MLDQLSALARETSSGKRRELMGAVADLFVSDAELYNDRELFLFGEVLIDLLDHVAVEDKVTLSTSVAPLSNTPRDLVEALVEEEIDVAAPILAQSPVLTDEDLVNIASTKTTEHRLVISQRDNLTEVVTDALISKGEEPVLQSVCKNMTASISDTGFHALADAAELNEVTRDLLSQRVDMTEEVVERVLPLLPEDARAKLKEIYDSGDGAAKAELIGEARQRASEAADQRKWKQVQNKVLLQEIMDGKRTIDEAIEGLGKSGRPLDIAFIIAGFTGLPEQQVLSALMNKNSQAIIVLCRALDISEPTFATLVEIRRKRFKLSPEASAKSLQDFAELEVSAAKRTMRFVKVRQVAS